MLYNLFSLRYAFSVRHFPPLAGLWVVSPISCWFSPFCLVTPRHDGILREGFDVGFPCLSACSHSIRPSSRPPRHADGTGEGFDGGCLAIASLFCLDPPPNGRYAAVFLPVVCPIVVSAFLSNIFFPIFPGFIARPFRGVGVGFVEPHLRLIFYLEKSRFPRISHTSSCAGHQGGLVLW